MGHKVVRVWGGKYESQSNREKHCTEFPGRLEQTGKKDTTAEILSAL